MRRKAGDRVLRRSFGKRDKVKIEQELENIFRKGLDLKIKLFTL